LAGAVRRGGDRLEATVFASAFQHLARAGTATEPAAGTGERERQRLVQGSVLYATRVAGADVDAGVELRDESIRSGRVRSGEMDIGSIAGYAQASVPFGGWTLVPGVRVTRSGTWGTHIAPRAAAMFRPNASVALRASVGSGYRAPHFKELAMQFLHIGPGFGYSVRGNPDLLPETSVNVTAGAEWSGERVYLRAQAFANRLHDFIETQLTGDSAGVQLYTYDNIASGETSGLELEAATTFGGVRLETGYALLRTEGADGLPLLGRPEHSARASLSWVRPSGLRLTLTSLHTGSTPVARDGNDVATRDAYTRFDARVARTLPRGLEVAVGADNLFDARPERWPGFAGRHVYASVSWKAGATDTDGVRR
jgi:outer membrane receptor protein involved in Fe transport